MEGTAVAAIGVVDVKQPDMVCALARLAARGPQSSVSWESLEESVSRKLPEQIRVDIRIQALDR